MNLNVLILASVAIIASTASSEIIREGDATCGRHPVAKLTSGNPVCSSLDAWRQAQQEVLDEILAVVTFASWEAESSFIANFWRDAAFLNDESVKTQIQLTSGQREAVAHAMDKQSSRLANKLSALRFASAEDKAIFVISFWKENEAALNVLTPDQLESLIALVREE